MLNLLNIGIFAMPLWLCAHADVSIQLRAQQTLRRVYIWSNFMTYNEKCLVDTGSKVREPGLRATCSNLRD